jgi:hypothetical protein
VKDYHGRWIGVDFDGVLATHDGTFKGEDHVGTPIKPMVDKVKKWIKDGIEVRIFTARRPSPAVRRWSKEHLGQVLRITDKKDPEMIAFYDDRGVGVVRNTGELFSEENEIQALKR